MEQGLRFVFGSLASRTSHPSSTFLRGWSIQARLAPQLADLLKLPLCPMQKVFHANHAAIFSGVEGCMQDDVFNIAAGDLELPTQEFIVNPVAQRGL